MKSARDINRRYEDPLDLLWTETARRLGMVVTRSAEVFASWDGRGSLQIGRPDDLDPDDCLAQMILHEICHWLVGDPESRNQVDWGLDNSSDHDLVFELAAMRLQAALTAPHGLRTVLAVTTEWRHLYDALPMDPLADSGSTERATLLAQEGWKRAAQPDIAEPLQAALSTTATIISLTKPFASSDTLFSTFEASS